jgi:hypothetical protein
LWANTGRALGLNRVSLKLCATRSCILACEDGLLSATQLLSLLAVLQLGFSPFSEEHKSRDVAPSLLAILDTGFEADSRVNCRAAVCLQAFLVRGWSLELHD